MSLSRSAIAACVGGGLILTSFVGLGIRLWWASATPKRPKNLPINATWVPGPNEGFALSKRGVWIGCWVDGEQNRCLVTDYNGAPEYEGQFLPFSGIGPVSEGRLHLRSRNTMELWAWLDNGNKSVPVVHLDDGTVLLPVEGYQELKAKLSDGALQ
jgi:hypothetical protein